LEGEKQVGIKINLLTYGIIILLALGTCVTSDNVRGRSGTTAVISVDAGKVMAKVSPTLINGFNFNNAMQVYTIRDIIERLHITTITYPAGNIGDEQNHTEYDLKFFKTQQEYLGNPFTFVQTRLYGGTPEDAVEAIRLTKKLGIRVDVWTIGNEPDLYDRKRGDASWTPEKYCKVFRGYAKKMKGVDPDIKLGGPAVSQPKDGWIRKFIYECGDIVDVLIWHWYPTSGNLADFLAVETATLAYRMIDRYKEWLVDPEMNPKGYNRPIKTAITEWALHWDTPKFRHLTDMTAVLWSAQVLAIYAEMELDYAHYFCLNWLGGHAIFNQLNRPRLMYYLFVLFAEHWGKEVVMAYSPDDEVCVWATRHGDRDISVFLIHIGEEQTKKIDIAVDNFPAIEKAEVWELVKEVDKKQKLNHRTLTIKGSIRIRLKPWSLTVVRIKG
jgi:hypothetical protein